MCLLGAAVTLCFTWMYPGNRLEPADYVQWVSSPENGLKVTEQVGQYRFQLQYKPADFVIANEQKKTELATSLVERRREQLQEMQYFNLRISGLGNNANPTESETTTAQSNEDRRDFFSFQFGSHLLLADGADTIPCTLFHMIPSGTDTQVADFVLGFEAPEQNMTEASAKTLLIDGQPFGTETIGLTITSTSIHHIPTLITK